MHQANSNLQQQQTWDSLIDRGCFFFGASALFSRRFCAADVCWVLRPGWGGRGTGNGHCIARCENTRREMCAGLERCVRRHRRASSSTLCVPVVARTRSCVCGCGMFALTPCCWCGVMVVWWSVLLGMSLGYCGSRALER